MKIEHIERTKRMIEVMQAYVDGRQVEYSLSGLNTWESGYPPSWNWEHLDYRIAELETHDSINWDHVAPEFKYMARDENGKTWLFKDKPEIIDDIWTDRNMEHAGALAYASYRRGTVDWKDSLVIRQGCE